MATTIEVTEAGDVVSLALCSDGLHILRVNYERRQGNALRLSGGAAVTA